MNTEPELTYIYGLFNPIDDKIVYIGKSNNVKQRLASHINSVNSKTGKNTIKAKWILSLLRKNIKPEIKIIAEVPFLDWQFWEKHYIKMFKSFGAKLYNGTNGGDGGDGGLSFTKETINRMSLAQKGKKQSPERAEKSRQSLKKARELPHPLLGLKQSESTKQKRADKIRGIKRSGATKIKMSNAQRGRKISEKALKFFNENLKEEKKPVLQFDLNNNFVKEWPFIRSVNITSPSNVSQCCLNKRKTAGKFIWKFKN